MGAKDKVNSHISGQGGRYTCIWTAPGTGMEGDHVPNPISCRCFSATSGQTSLPCTLKASSGCDTAHKCRSVESPHPGSLLKVCIPRRWSDWVGLGPMCLCEEAMGCGPSLHHQLDTLNCFLCRKPCASSLLSLECFCYNGFNGNSGMPTKVA
jgi:hypothetical protein